MFIIFVYFYTFIYILNFFLKMLQYLYFYVLFIYSDLSYIKKEALQMLLHNKTFDTCGVD